MRVADLGRPQARGRTADVYAWEGGQVLKLFHEWFDRDAIEHERRLAGVVQAAGLPVPAVGEIVEVDGLAGLLYERVEGVTMLAAIERRPWRAVGLARTLAAVHARMHATVLELDLPSQRERLDRKVRAAAALSEPDRAEVLRELEALPGGDRICHGDFHPGNVLLTARGEMVIDWIDASIGNPLADVARSSVLARGHSGIAHLHPLRGLLICLFHASYLHRYFALRPGGEPEFRRWLPVVAAARLSENIPELEAWLVREAGKLARGKKDGG